MVDLSLLLLLVFLPMLPPPPLPSLLGLMPPPLPLPLPPSARAYGARALLYVAQRDMCRAALQFADNWRVVTSRGRAVPALAPVAVLYSALHHVRFTTTHCHIPNP